MSVNSLIKIDVNDRQDVYLISSFEEQNKHLRVILLDENKCEAFYGKATDIDLRSQAATMKMIFSDFMSLTLKALTKIKSNSNEFLYGIEKRDHGFIFQWKSIDQDETIINIGSIKIIESDFRSMTKEAFCLISEEMASLKEKLADMNEELCNLRKEMDNSMHLLTDMNDMKTRVENELYSKFILVLNEKKRKIRELKQKTNEAPLNKLRKNHKMPVKSRKIHQVSDSSNEDESGPEEMDIGGPSTSKCNNSLLFFDDDEPELKISPSKKRNRKQYTTPISHVNNNKTKAQPVIAMESESEDELLNLL